MLTASSFLFLLLLQIIATRPKGIRRTSSRRGGAKGQLLGNQSVAPATRARAAPASNGAKVVSAAATAPQPTDKIIVSNLPPDVNEAQVKVSFQPYQAMSSPIDVYSFVE